MANHVARSAAALLLLLSAACSGTSAPVPSANVGGDAAAASARRALAPPASPVPTPTVRATGIPSEPPPVYCPPIPSPLPVLTSPRNGARGVVIHGGSLTARIRFYQSVAANWEPPVSLFSTTQGSLSGGFLSGPVSSGPAGSPAIYTAELSHLLPRTQYYLTLYPAHNPACGEPLSVEIGSFTTGGRSHH
jgi:hypothetical protein